MFLKDVIKEFVFEIRLRNYSERTIKGYKNNISKFARYIEVEFELVEIEDISHVHIKNYLNYLKSKGLTEVYINTILKNLRSFYK
ncbi:phage integrase N-terminal SAM-like domain-containing protein, partial [Clostridium perfringens]